MSNLAKVICLLLTTGATSVSVHFSLDKAQASFDSTVFHTEAHSAFQYGLVERKLKNSSELAASALKHLTAWDNSSDERVAEKRQCYEDYIKSCHLELKDLPKARQVMHRHLEESKLQVKNCRASKAKIFKNIEAAKCIIQVREKFLPNFARASSTFDKVIRKMNAMIEACNELLPPLVV